MKGSIRFALGLLLVWGTAGSMDSATDSQLIPLTLLAAAGLYSMYSGARALQNA
jgi:hypothetical protein